MTEETEESVAHHARKLGREYADTFHPTFTSTGKKWIRYAFARGYQQACIDNAEAAKPLDEAVQEFEESEEEFDFDALYDYLEYVDRTIERVKR